MEGALAGKGQVFFFLAHHRLHIGGLLLPLLEEQRGWLMVIKTVNLVEGQAQADEVQQILLNGVTGDAGTGADGLFAAALGVQAQQ